MKHENDPWPVCNFCEEAHDPYDRHTCKGNNVEARKRDPLHGEGYRESDDTLLCDHCKERYQCGHYTTHLATCAPFLREHGADDTLADSAPTVDDLIRINNEVSKIPYDKDWRTPVPPDYPDFEGLPGYAGSALDSQPGGDHYRKHAIQPVEYIVANGIGFLAGNIIKYATRYRDKGGAEDIRKIIHYAQLILEFEYKETSK